MGYSPYCLQERTFFRKWRFSCFFGFFYILICSKLWGLYKMTKHDEQVQVPVKKEKSGFVIWCLAILFGWLGVHSFLSKHYVWGLLHFLMGGLPFALIKGAQHGLCTPRQYYIAYALMFIQLILNIYDVLNISRGKYSNGTGSVVYRGHKMMVIASAIFAGYSLRHFFFVVCGLLEAIANAVPT